MTLQEEIQLLGDAVLNAQRRIAALESRLKDGESELAALRLQFNELLKTMVKAFTAPDGTNLYGQLRRLESRLDALENFSDKEIHEE